MDDSEAKNQVLELLETQDWEPASADIALDETIVPAEMDPESTLEPAVEVLPDLTSGVEELDIGDVLGEGGMGVVHLAHQRSLSRDVAVKRLKPDQRNPHNLRRLLREARLTGWLEHPSIIPVYVLGRDRDDTVLFAMKRIEGTPWREFFDRPERAAERADTGDPLDFHLDVLMQVCQAVHFAHSKGIVHRDIKPENVMIGDFGEVYLLDWGIAVRLKDDEGHRPERSETRQGLAGTPMLMAPEMVSGRGQSIDERTDVYLLGAVLHVVLTGKPRHQGDTLPEVLVRATSSEPVDYGDDVPAELAAIANKATRRDPDERFASAEAFRRAVAEFLLHRGSDRLCREAGRRLDRLCEMARGDGALSDEVAQDAYRLFAECRFGFQQALAEWESNPEAVAGLQGVLELMIDIEIRQRALAAAASLLAELPEPNPALEARIERLKRELAEEQAEVERLRRISRAVDVELGTRTRSIVCLILAAPWGVPDTVIGVLDAADVWRPSYSFLTVRTVVFAVILAVAAWVKREVLLGNVANRRIIGSGLILFVNQLLIWLVGWNLGFGLEASAALTTISFGIITGMMAITIDKRIWLASGFMFAGALGSCLWLGFAFGFLGLAAIAGLVALAYVWREPSLKVEDPGSEHGG